MSEQIEQFVNTLKNTLFANGFPKSKVAIPVKHLAAGADSLGIEFANVKQELGVLGIKFTESEDEKLIFEMNMISIKETSFNSDDLILKSFINHVDKLPNLELKKSFKNDFLKDAFSVKLDNEERFSYTINYFNFELTLGVLIFMDDVESPDVTLYCHPLVIELFEEIYDQITEELGV